ncbi:sulfotransferase family 5A, member 1 [Nelusetta ayraudi]|uniref:sulfotransferase family 5A, member 1 n=1 Tax=Nelusetta ayraudi TaxID=303726 RepID=UPI003F714D2D
MERLNVMEMFHGISFPGHLHTQDSLQLALKFPFQESDILIASYPKSGTTWMQELVSLVLNRGDPHLSHTVPNWARAPWLEQHYFPSLLKSPSVTPRVITTHLPFHLLAPALQGSKTKVVYVSRNPRDVAVSFFHFHKMAAFLPECGTFAEFLDQFLEGAVCYGSWFDHVKDWTRGADTQSNLLQITYEEMSRDLRGAIQKVSSFLRRPLAEDELSSCAKHCNFDSMKDNRMVNYSLIPAEIMDHNKGAFMRKGKIGDWKNTFTEEQDQLFDSVFRSKMKGCALEFVWGD